MSWTTVTEEMALQEGTPLANLIQRKMDEGYVTYYTYTHEAVGIVVQMCTIEEFAKKMARAIEARQAYLDHKEEHECDDPNAYSMQA